MGGDEYFNNGICIIEWGQILESILPKNYLKIDFENIDENTRILNILPMGDFKIEDFRN